MVNITNNNSDAGYFYFLILIVALAWSMSIGVTRVLGMFIQEFESEFNVKQSEVSLLFNYTFGGSLLNCLTAPFILKYFGPRKMMFLGGLGTSTAWFATSQLNSLLAIHICMGLFLSYFVNMFFFCSNIVFQSWMNKKRVFGNSTVFCGVPAGALILSPFFAYLIDEYTWRGTCMIQERYSIHKHSICCHRLYP